jgi:hypothetical protein
VENLRVWLEYYLGTVADDVRKEEILDQSRGIIYDWMGEEK